VSRRNKFMSERTPWQKIRDAGERGTGLRLNAEEVGRLAFDNAIFTRAENDDAEDNGEEFDD